MERICQNTHDDIFLHNLDTFQELICSPNRRFPFLFSSFFRKILHFSMYPLKLSAIPHAFIPHLLSSCHTLFQTKAPLGSNHCFLYCQVTARMVNISELLHCVQSWSYFAVKCRYFQSFSNHLSIIAYVTVGHTKKSH